MKSFEFEQVSQCHPDIRVILDNQYGMRRSRFDPSVRIRTQFLIWVYRSLRTICLRIEGEGGCLDRHTLFRGEGMSIIRPGCASFKMRHSTGGDGWR